MKRYRITVDQAAIAEGRPAIHVHDRQSDERQNFEHPLILHNAVVQQGPAQQDGARVWIDCDFYLEDRAGFQRRP